MMSRKPLIWRFLPLLVPVIILTGWELAVRAELVPPSHAATPSDVLVRLCSLVFSGELPKHAYHSFIRLAVAVCVGATAGILSSGLLALFRLPDRLLSPSIQLLAGIPVVVWIPFWVMFFGTGEGFKISMVAISTFFLVHVYTFQAMRSLPREYIELAKMYEKSFWEIFRHILLPHITPAVFTALRVALAFAWIVLFFVEYASARQGTEGLGWFIADARAMGKVESEFAGLAFLGLLAFVTDNVVNVVKKRLLAWSDTLDTLVAQEPK